MARLLLAVLTLVPALFLLLPAFAAAAGFVLVAGVVHALARRLEAKFVSWKDLMTFDARLGWKPRADLDVYYLADRDDVYRVVTDHEGWPGKRSIEESRAVVIGDSFAFGYGVDSGHSFTDRIPSFPMKAIGAPGYSMVQGVLLMEQLAQRLSGKLVVWFICLENDLQDTVAPALFRYRAPFARLSPKRGEWEIVTEHVVPISWQSPDWSWKRTFPHLCVPGPLADRVYGGCDYLIERASAACELVNAQLVLVTIPELMQLSEDGRAKLAALSGNPEACDVDLPDRRLAESCLRHNVRIIVGKQYLSPTDYKSREGLHWNEEGHRRVATLLAELSEPFSQGDVARASSLAPLQL